MTYSEIKQVKQFCESLHSEPDYREVIEYLSTGDDDFTVDDVRFIHSDAIDQVQEEELGSDLYILGCFNASFLSSILDIDYDVIETMQQAEAYEAVGKLIISLGKLSEVQQDYASADGYGHHFNHYDFGEEEFNGYHVFDNH